jgi:hypothetical protein
MSRAVDSASQGHARVLADRGASWIRPSPMSWTTAVTMGASLDGAQREGEAAVPFLPPGSWTAR